MLRLKKTNMNTTAIFTLPGNPDLMAGVTVMLSGGEPGTGDISSCQAKQSPSASPDIQRK
jgi:hypothetical protein